MFWVLTKNASFKDKTATKTTTNKVWLVRPLLYITEKEWSYSIDSLFFLVCANYPWYAGWDFDVFLTTIIMCVGWSNASIITVYIFPQYLVFVPHLHLKVNIKDWFCSRKIITRYSFTKYFRKTFFLVTLSLASWLRLYLVWTCFAQVTQCTGTRDVMFIARSLCHMRLKHDILHSLLT